MKKKYLGAKNISAQRVTDSAEQDVLLHLKIFAARDDLVAGDLVVALLRCGAGWHPAAGWQPACPL
jgi:hypothetical protein